MRFIDASVFVYAYLKPRAALPPDLRAKKEGAETVIKRVEEGEEVVTTVVHLSEVANIIEVRAGIWRSAEVVLSVLAKRNVRVEGVSSDEYFRAARAAGELGVGVNDALAALVMRRLGVAEVYSFDKHLDRIDWVKRVEG